MEVGNACQRLSDILEVRKGDVLSIVGAGGKTTCLHSLGEELRPRGRVLMTTTTKIWVPERKQYDVLMLMDQSNSFEGQNGSGIYIVGQSVTQEQKLMGIGETALQQLVPDFDYTLIEADGSKEKPLKGWNPNEPVIFAGTTKTVGIVSIKAVGLRITEENIHRVHRFCHIGVAHYGKRVRDTHLMNMIAHPEGLFKQAKGEKILFINQVESLEEERRAEYFLDLILRQKDRAFDRCVYGSLRKQRYRRLD